MSRTDPVDFDRYEHENHDRGLAFDVNTLFARRRALKLMGGAGLLALVGCATTDTATTSTSSTAASSSAVATAAASSATMTAASSSGDTTSSGALAELADIPEETAGPFPGDGTNGPNVLTASGIVRSDIRSSFGTSSTSAAGVPLTVTLNIQDNNSGVVPLTGAAVYIWHCDINGKYSMYGQGVTNENYLRGVQETDAKGSVTFTTIFPAAYSGRWPHIHFEVYPSLAEATSAGEPRATSQLALPADICDVVYATEGYGQSVKNLAQTSLTRDMVFGNDGGVHQLATVTGNVTDGYLAVLDLAV